MLRKLKPWQIALLVLVALLAAYYMTIPILGPHFFEVCRKGKYGPPDDCQSWDAVTAAILRIIYFLDDHNGLVAALATCVVAAFTGVLYVVTGRAADAGRAAADALPIVERAYVYPEIVSDAHIDQFIKTALVYYTGDPLKTNTRTPDVATIKFRIKNLGKTPAVLSSVYAGFDVAPLTLLGGEIGIDIPDAIIGSGESTGELTCNMLHGISQSHAVNIRSHQAAFVFQGTITFQDIWDIQHTTEFSFKWNPDICRMSLRFIKTTKTDYPKYY